MKERFFITGATGNVGSEVVKNILKTDNEVIAAKLTDETRAGEGNLSYKNFDFTDESTWQPCMDGVSKVFLMRPPQMANIKRDMLPFMKFMKERGVTQVVFMSVQGAEKNKLVPHYKVEKYLEELELPYTFVRPAFFMQNLTTTHLPEIRDEHMLFVPAGKGRTNFIDARDIGEVIAKMFFDPVHINKAYTVTGERSYSYAEVAERLSSLLNVPVQFVDPNPIRFIAYHLKRGRKLGFALIMFALYSVVKSGNGDVSTNTTEQILGRKPRGLDSFIIDNKDLFLGKE